MVAVKPVTAIKAHDRVRVREGTFADMEGRVDAVVEPSGHLRLTMTIFGHPVPVELEVDQVELIS